MLHDLVLHVSVTRLVTLGYTLTTDWSCVTLYYKALCNTLYHITKLMTVLHVT